MQPAVTRVVEDYLTLIWKAREWPGTEPTTTDLANKLRVTPSTVSANLKKLARDRFIEYEPYGQIELTDTGRRVAVDVVRRHRITETYLVQELGLAWDEVHDEADLLEHAISDKVLDRMNEILGFPTADPHGDPIPDADGAVCIPESYSLRDVQPAVHVQVVRVSDHSPELLRYLEQHCITVGTVIEVAELHLAAATLHVRVGADLVVLSLHAAAAVRVCPVRPQ